MPQNSDDYKYQEEWTAVINKRLYKLNADQSDLVKKAIDEGSRAIIRFKEFVINIPMIQEFYLERRMLKPEYQLSYEIVEEDNFTPDKLEENLEKIKELKKKAHLIQNI